MESLNFEQEMIYNDESNSPLKGTTFEYILNNIQVSNQICNAGPVIQIPHDYDVMLHTRNCKNLHEYLNKDRFDVAKLQRMLNEEFGELVGSTTTTLNQYFQQNITNIREYFTLIDAIVAEMYQTEHIDIRNMQRQECFILANNFVGPEQIHADMFVSRILVPMLNVL